MSRENLPPETSGQFQLLGQRRFAPFFWTQFLGALNDNVFKTALITALTYQGAAWSNMDSGTLANLIPGLFIAPFVLFSATAGQFAEKYDKAALTRFIKMLEIGIMLLAGAGWLTKNLPILLVCVFLMGVHSTLFGPVKYAYLPQHLHERELTGGNGVIEMGTFVGILLGQILGAMLVTKAGIGIELIAGGALLLAVLGWGTSRAIPVSPAAAPDLKINYNPFTETWRNLSFSRQNRAVFLSLLGNSWFWFYGAIVLAQFPDFAKVFLHGNEQVFVLLLGVFSIGVGAGSLLCEKLSGHKVEIGLVPFGSIGLTVFGVDLFFAANGYHSNLAQVDAAQFVQQSGAWRILADCMLIGIFGGFYIVPLFALIQTRCDKAHLSRTIAGMNIMNAAFMVVATGCAIVMLKLHFTLPQIFLATALMNAVVAVYIFTLVPEFLMRFVAWLLLKTIHRVKCIGVEQIPEDGPAVLVCNHVSYVDALVILASSPRPIRFVMDHRIFKTPVLGWVFLAVKAIPIAPAKEDQQTMEKAYDEIAHALREGELVCIFPEGRLTTTGDVNEFKGGVRKIVERSPVPVIPMALRGLWGSLLTRSDGNPLQRSFKRGLLSRLELVVGAPQAPQQVTPEGLREQVLALRGEWK
ncbi:MFS transporter [Massilia sp. W12]|uniref:MFS transporter n=1 Tax=Massilia sp. W12 TaxID=3126507 RepID=UPI0030D42FF3